MCGCLCGCSYMVFVGLLGNSGAASSGCGTCGGVPPDGGGGDPVPSGQVRDTHGHQTPEPRGTERGENANSI